MWYVLKRLYHEAHSTACERTPTPAPCTVKKRLFRKRYPSRRPCAPCCSRSRGRGCMSARPRKSAAGSSGPSTCSAANEPRGQRTYLGYHMLLASSCTRPFIRTRITTCYLYRVEPGRTVFHTICLLKLKCLQRQSSSPIPSAQLYPSRPLLEFTKADSDEHAYTFGEQVNCAFARRVFIESSEPWPWGVSHQAFGNAFRSARVRLGAYYVFVIRVQYQIKNRRLI